MDEPEHRARRLRQPAALPWLLCAHGAERAGYYGLRSFLVLFLVEHHVASGSEAYALYATWTSLLLVAPILGGHLADRHLGRQKAVLAGLVLGFLGAVLLFWGRLVPLSLGLFVAGGALFRPSLAALVGDLYPRGDGRRDAGFTLFAVAGSAAGVLAPLAFALARKAEAMSPPLDPSTPVVPSLGAAMVAAAMLAAGGAFLAAQRSLRAEGFHAGELEAPPARVGARDVRGITVAVVASGLLVSIALVARGALRPIWDGAGSLAQLGAVVGLVGILAGIERAVRSRRGSAPRRNDAARSRLVTFVLLIALGALFWTSMNLASPSSALFEWARRKGGSGLRFEAYGLLDAGLFTAFGLCLPSLWRRLDEAPRRTSGLTKMSAGLLLLGVSAAIGAARGREPGLGALASASALAVLAELCFEPIGMSMASKLAPPGSLALAMGLWGAVPLIGTRIAAGLADSPLPPTAVPALAIGGGLLLLVLGPFLERTLRGAEDPPIVKATAAGPYRAGEIDVAGAARDPIADPWREDEVRDDRANEDVFLGLLWAAGGVTVTMVSVMRDGGGYIVAYGAVAYGLLRVARGFGLRR